jgi:hypothetical protein
MTVRDRIRVWLGLWTVEAQACIPADIFALEDRVSKMETVLSDEIERLRNDVIRLKGRQRSDTQAPRIPDTWEEIQAAYAANPENFKEIA